MVRTHGLTHINLAVRDLTRSVGFYEQVFGCQTYWRDESTAHLQTPGCHDVITLEQKPEGAAPTGGIAHFGFRLLDPADIDAAIQEAEAAGGVLLRRGAFAPGLPYAYVSDPDGYEVEIWYE
jgi:catechol 2,3-dioxygenase-like lactoylglutathione lyase family enzyme